MSERSLATRRVMKTVARRTAAEPLPVRAEDGTYPIVVSLPDDKLLDVARHVKREFNGAANVFVTLPDHIALINFSFASQEDSSPDRQMAGDATSMAMYVEYLKMHDGPASITIDMAAASSAVRDIAYAF